MKNINRKSLFIFVIIFIFCSSFFFIVEKKLYINLTRSMPIGIYKKLSKNNYEIGDIIVFYHEYKRGNLIKYVSGLSGDRYCIGDDGTFWINEIPQAVLNIQKYGQFDQSICYQLKQGEALVIGEHPDSYDSRYFGPIREEKIIAIVSLLIEFKN